MSEQNEDASELDKSEEVLLVPFVSDDDPAVVLEPSEKPFDLPASFVSAQGSSVLCLCSLSVAPVRSDDDGSELCQDEFVERVAVVSTVADEIFRLGFRSCRSRSTIVPGALRDGSRRGCRPRAASRGDPRSP